MAEERKDKPLVYVVENDGPTRALISLRLTRMGCQVVTAVDGAAALDLLQKQAPRVLILDTFLPKVGGLDVLKKASATEWLTATRVIVISSLGFQEVVQQAIDAGAHTFLMKPIDVEILEERIKPFLNST